MRGGDVFKLQQILGHANIAMTMTRANLDTEIVEIGLNRVGRHQFIALYQNVEKFHQIRLVQKPWRMGLLGNVGFDL